MPKEERETSFEALMHFTDRALALGRRIAGDQDMTPETESEYEEQLSVLEKEARALGIT